MPKIEVDEDLKEIIPGFMANRNKDILELERLLQEQDFHAIEKIGHRVAGSSGGYGFDELGNIAKEIELSIKGGDTSKIPELIENFKEYVNNVEIEFV